MASTQRAKEGRTGHQGTCVGVIYTHTHLNCMDAQTGINTQEANLCSSPPALPTQHTCLESHPPVLKRPSLHHLEVFRKHKRKPFKTTAWFPMAHNLNTKPDRGAGGSSVVRSHPTSPTSASTTGHPSKPDTAPPNPQGKPPPRLRPSRPDHLP